MNKREMARDMVRWGEVCSRENRATDALLLKEGAAALEREAEREEQERKKVTLAQMAGHIQRVFTSEKACDVLPCPMCSAAFDVLRKLDNEGGEFLQEIVLIERLHKFLRSLGVEKKT